MAQTITPGEFQKLDLRMGEIVAAERVAGADKLIVLKVDLGTEQRQIVVGMAEFFAPDELVGKQVPILANMEPRSFRGVRSEGMVLAADVEGRPVLLQPEQRVPPGTMIR